MSLRKSSCTACVSAKRRCDRGVPSCNRCDHKCLPCKYPYQRSLHSAPAAGLPPNEFTFPTTPVLGNLGSSETLLEQGAFPVANLLASGFPSLDDSLAWNWDALCPQPAIDLPASEQISPSETNSLNGLSWSMFTDLNSNQVSTSDPTRRTEEIQRHRRKAYSRLCPQDQLRMRSTSVIGSSLQAHQVWPRGQDIATWQFCARELLSFVNVFATTASNSFILQPFASSNSISHNGLPLPLQRALGICATAYTLTESGQNILDQMLETEMEHLVNEFGSHGVSIREAFRQDLARLQAMVLYQTIALFSTRARQQLLAKKYEPLVASWSRELLLRIQVLELHKKDTPMSPFLQSEGLEDCAATMESAPDTVSGREFPGTKAAVVPYDKPLHESEIDSAYRTVLTSYMARSVHSALIYQSWLSKPSITISYNEFPDRWNQKKGMLGLNKHDRFLVLLLAACKGVDAMNGLA
ncbi:hypothetical protein DER46DRAFT_558612 [Fusarium sp. MPI-SDFR-AT-0072]|nr:hypothetical protein DER46DRAFT_558612 [Fusarium sp. MPI-SDFR-AT-0072]